MSIDTSPRTSDQSDALCRQKQRIKAEEIQEHLELALQHVSQQIGDIAEMQDLLRFPRLPEEVSSAGTFMDKAKVLAEWTLLVVAYPLTLLVYCLDPTTVRQQRRQKLIERQISSAKFLTAQAIGFEQCRNHHPDCRGNAKPFWQIQRFLQSARRLTDSRELEELEFLFMKLRKARDISQQIAEQRDSEMLELIQPR